MKICSLIIIFSIFLTISVNGQTAKEAKSGIYGEVTTDKDAPVFKLAFGQSLSISPNPLQKTHPILTISAVNIEIYSYTVFTAAGQIVELENLSGRPDGSIIDLSGAVNLGTYIIRFDTNSGSVTRKFMVI